MQNDAVIQSIVAHHERYQADVTRHLEERRVRRLLAREAHASWRGLAAGLLRAVADRLEPLPRVRPHTPVGSA